MTIEAPKKPLEESLRDIAAEAEQELRRVAAYINDQVVPEVRRNGSGALRTAAQELGKLAERLDAANRRTPPPK